MANALRRCALFATTTLAPLLLGLAVWSMNCPAVLAQVPDTITQHVVEMWQEDAGLPQNYVSAIRQSRDGYIWVGTRSGVARFDGVRFTTYDDLHPDQLKESEVSALAEDDERGMWVGTYGGGLSRIQGGRVTATFLARDGLPDDIVTALAAAPDGSLWIGTPAGLARHKDGRFMRYGPRDGFVHDRVRALHVDARGVIWIGTDNGLWSHASGSFVSHGAARPGELSGRVDVVASGPDGAIWLSMHRADGAGDGVRRLRDGQVARFTTGEGLASNSVMSIAVRSDGAVWVGTHGGLNRYVNGRFERYVSDGPAIGGHRMLERASRDGVSALAFDREGNLWFGTALDGAGRMLESPFLTVSALAREQGLDVKSVYGEPDGAMWIGTAHELRRLRGSTSTIYRYGQPPGQTIETTAIDSRGRLFAGYAHGLLELRNGRLQLHPDPANNDIDVIVLFADRRGDVWIGTRNQGAYRLSGDRLIPFTWREGLLGSEVRGIGEDGRGGIWVGTRDGGVTCRRGGTTARFGVEQGLSSPAVQALYVDRDDTVWAATRTGLNRIKDGRVSVVTARQGLPANYLYQVTGDDEGHLWLTHARGIARVSREELNAVADGRSRQLTFVPYGMDSGMKSTTMSVAHQPTVWKAPDGRLWFATARGVEVIDPRRTLSNPMPPPVLVEELRVGHDAHPIADAMSLDPTRAEISISYTALSFVAPNRVLFKYRLEGFDSGWVDAGTRRIAYYANLPHGRYRFRVIACNNDGVWNEAGASFTLEVLPRWHERLLLRLLGAAAFGLAVLGLFRARVGRLKRRERDLAARVEERTHELQDLTATLEQRVSDRTAELEKANEALSSERERLAVTLGSIADGVVATDVAGHVVLMNRVAEQISGWTSADAIGESVHAVLPVVERETRRPLVDANPGEGLEAPFTPASPFLLQRPDGHEAVLAGSMAPIRDPRSRRVGTVFVFRDITERERIDERLRNTQRLEALGVLAGGIAHDFNNLLTGVFGFVDVARDPETDPAHARDLLQRALGVIEKARGLTRQLLTFSKAGEPVRKPAALEPIVRNAAGFVLAGSKVVAEWCVASGLWLCEVDGQQVDQIVDNLLINARQAMPEGGTVTLELANVRLAADAVTNRPAGPYVRLTVRDQGPGIPRELQARVLEPFFTTKPGGSGLGLATVYSIVRRHGGHLEIESEEGAGAAFHVFLPAVPGESAAPRPASAPEPAPVPTSARVLVMDDEDYVRDVARQMLTRLGYDVLVAKDDSEAVDLLRAAGERGERVDVAILDITIPGGLGGAAALQRLREVAPRLPAIASSGYSGDTIMARPAEHGFDGALPKPYTLANIRAVMGSVLSARRA